MKLATTLLALAMFAACKREPRCEQCGMKIVPGDPFEAIVEVAGKEKHFDTPRCAFEAAPNKNDVRVQEYYDRTWMKAADLKLVKNSDVMGPMGKDFIPVNASHVEKFLRDHGGVVITPAETGAAKVAP
jgi:copper chaperone NosL